MKVILSFPHGKTDQERNQKGLAVLVTQAPDDDLRPFVWVPKPWEFVVIGDGGVAGIVDIINNAGGVAYLEITATPAA